MVETEEYEVNDIDYHPNEDDIPLCKDCKYHKRDKIWRDICRHPKSIQMKDLVSGKIFYTHCEDMRKVRYFSFMDDQSQEVEGPCGYYGVLFEKRTFIDTLKDFLRL